MVTQLIISIILPLNGAAIYATCSQVPKDNTARIYFINLLISDLIQLYSLTALLMFGEIFIFIYIFGVMVSVGFMVCITLDRYLVITRLRCSCIRQTIQISGVVCFVVWFVPLCIVIRIYPLNDFQGMFIFAISLLLPYPLLIFLLCGTFRALCTASSVPPREKCRIVASVVLVLLIYSLLLLPTIIFLLGNELRYHHYIYVFNIYITMLCPLADTLLYFFLRKEAVDKPLNFLCCSKKERNDMSSSAVNDDDNMHAESSV
ncbi:G-protein coupled receptor 4-like [Anabas testudineus]|uniref:G-protein coupled receptor 4-like n=1 Tax=Anabas testudineus TaxID=64144 RepID=UPI000E45441F|nr:G-protein coupled receptor 4-like [Anabas testudineus]